jgi:Kelch motif protein/kelch motif-containing protein
MSSLLQRRLTIPATLAMLLFSAAVAVLAQASWTKAAPFPEPAEELYGIAANGKIYVMGGYEAGKPLGIVQEYDPAADKWTKKKPMARPAHHEALAEYRGKIYMMGGFVAPTSGQPGGWQPIDNAWEFDPVADSWKALAPLPTKRGSAFATEVGGKIYVIGGASTHPGAKEIALYANGPGRSVGANEAYDPATNKWEPRSPMPTARNHAFGGLVGGKIYVIGGRLGSSFSAASSNSDVVEEYDPAVDSWGTVRAKMPTARSGGGWGTYGGRIYVAGGEVATPQLVGAFRAFEAYDPGTNQWTAMPSMPIPRHGVAGAVIGNRFHLVSGMVTGAAVGAGSDPGVHLHTSSHDVIELPGK